MAVSSDGTESRGRVRGRPVLHRIGLVYESLNEAERKVADLIRVNPGTARGLSITRLGELSGVSQTTVVRFCRTIGFEGYADFKLALVEELVPRTNALPDEHSDVNADDSLSVLVQKVLANNALAINSSFEIIDMDAFERSVEILTSAQTTELLAVGSSLPVAMDLYYRFLRSGIRCRMHVDGYTQAINARLLEPGDAAVAISYSGESRDTIEAVQLAKESGATIICVTNFPSSSLAAIADIRLITSSSKMRWLDEAVTARLVHLTLFDALCVAISRRRGPEALTMLDRIEKAVAYKIKQ